MQPELLWDASKNWSRTVSFGLLAQFEVPVERSHCFAASILFANTNAFDSITSTNAKHSLLDQNTICPKILDDGHSDFIQANYERLSIRTRRLCPHGGPSSQPVSSDFSELRLLMGRALASIPTVQRPLRAVGSWRRE